MYEYCSSFFSGFILTSSLSLPISSLRDAKQEKEKAKMEEWGQKERNLHELPYNTEIVKTGTFRLALGQQTRIEKKVLKWWKRVY